MDEQVVELAKQLLESGFDRFSDRERRVLTHVANRLHVTQNVNRAVEERQTLGDRLADRVARFGGSWTFIMIFIGVLIAWTGLNTAILTRLGQVFDPYPYIFLNLILSMLDRTSFAARHRSEAFAQPLTKFSNVSVLWTVVNSQVEVELCARAAIQDRMLTDSVGKSYFIVHSGSFAGEVGDKEFRGPDLVKDLLGDFARVLDVVGTGRTHSELSAYFLDCPLHVLKFWPLLVDHHHDKCCSRPYSE
jgi:low affinity Fe/Cu permease